MFQKNKDKGFSEINDQNHRLAGVRTEGALEIIFGQIGDIIFLTQELKSKEVPLKILKILLLLVNPSMQWH